MQLAVSAVLSSVEMSFQTELEFIPCAPLMLNWESAEQQTQKRCQRSTSSAIDTICRKIDQNGHGGTLSGNSGALACGDFADFPNIIQPTAETAPETV